jgi:hypothetical protein
MGQAGRAQLRFGRPVFAGQGQRRGVGMQQAGVGEQRHASALRGVDHVLVLCRALADFARRDQQQLVGALEGGVQRVGPVVVGLAHLHAQRRQLGRLGRLPHGGDDLAGRQALQQ